MPKYTLMIWASENAFLQEFPNPFALRTDKQQLLSNFILTIMRPTDIKDTFSIELTDNPSVDFILKDKKKS
ncbi:MAG: hypothetical protein IPN09_13495 [Bacteroidetes bacterium]|nr:hypothetical protein [Bacteroidota bacterium]